MAFLVEDPVESATIIQMRVVLRMMGMCRMETKKQLTKAYQDKSRVVKLKEMKSEETMKQLPRPFEESSRWLTRTYLTIKHISSNRFIGIIPKEELIRVLKSGGALPEVLRYA